MPFIGRARFTVADMDETAQGPGYIPLCRASALLPFVSFSEKIGAPVSRLLWDCKLPQQALETPEALFPLASGFRFVASVARSEGLPHLGFTVGLDTRFQDLGAFGRLVLESLTLHDALSKISSIIHLYNSAQSIWLERQGETTLICTAYRPRLDDGWMFGEQYTLTLLIQCIRAATRAAWLPSEIHLESTLFDLVQGRVNMLGVSAVKRRGVSAIAVETALLSVPMERLRRAGAATRDADFGVLSSSAPPTDFPGSVAHLSRLFMGDEQRQIESIASVMGVSVRTLQRRLAEHGVDFSTILELTRLEAAVALLDDGSRGIMEIALELGYGEVSSFSRAFRRWTGVSPSRFRKAHPSGG
jgi:AraC-like DNA-binding protein